MYNCIASALLNESRTSFPAMSENVFRNKNYEENISYPSILQQLSNSVVSLYIFEILIKLISTHENNIYKVLEFNCNF